LSKQLKFILLFLALYCFRTAFGLSQPFFSPDEIQTYLIGLKSFTTGSWPYFGPDLIVTETGFYSQIPGALEGLLIGLPFRVLPVPEAPFLLLNLLSLSALAFFSWYISKRLPRLSLYFIFAWLSLLPWNLHESTNPINPSYLLFGSSLFFVGFMECVPELSLNRISPLKSCALMGFGLFWDMQFHSSWILLPPLVLAALWTRWKVFRFQLFPMLEGFLAGSTFPLVFLLPTLLKFGFSHSAPGLGLAAGFDPAHLLSIYMIVPRFFSLASFEILRFLLIPGITHHLDFFRQHPLLVLPGVFLVVIGWGQVALMVLGAGWKDPGRYDSGAVTRWTFGILLLVWVSFWFTTKPPLAHIYYILFPLIGLYSLYIWHRLVFRRVWRVLGLLCIMANLWFETGYLYQAGKVQSLYLDRGKVLSAIEKKDYRVLGERRPGSNN